MTRTPVALVTGPSLTRSPYEIFPIAQENKYLGIIFRFFSDFLTKMYVVCFHLNRLIEAIQMNTHNITLVCDLPPVLALGLTRSGSNYSCLEEISMVLRCSSH